MYHELIYHLDLALLAYHAYTQTLVWPIDPYYEHMARAHSGRRDLFMAEVRARVVGEARYRGPGPTQGWPGNPDLDPVLMCHQRLYPWRPAFASPDIDSWVLYSPPAAISERIAAVHVARYAPGTGDPNSCAAAPEIAEVASKPGGGGTDQLYCFEGGTGCVDATPGLWSILGVVLERATDAGYDVHIAFRGRRSGAAARVVSEARRGLGNPDLVSDLDHDALVQDVDFSVHGAVCRGTSRALKTCVPTLLASLAAIHARRGGPPGNIHVTGHGLGGGLAALFAAAVTVGQTHGPLGARLRDGLELWPWRRLRLITFSASVVGGFQFQREFNAKVFARRVVVRDQPITRGARRFPVGAEVYVDDDPAGPFDPREPRNLRARLIRKLQQWGDDVTTVPDPRPTDPGYPWRRYASFLAMFDDHAGFRAHALRDMLAGFDVDMRLYLTIYGLVMSQRSSYFGYTHEATRIAREQAVQLALTRMGSSTAFTDANPAPALAALKVAIRGLQAPFNAAVDHVLRGFLLAELAQNPRLDFDDLRRVPALVDCFR